MAKVKGFWLGVGVGILSAIVVFVIGLRGGDMKSSTIFFSGVVPPSLRVRSVLTPATERGSMATSSNGPKWAQKTITLPPQRRGCHLITPKVSSFECFFQLLFTWWGFVDWFIKYWFLNRFWRKLDKTCRVSTVVLLMSSVSLLRLHSVIFFSSFCLNPWLKVWIFPSAQHTSASLTINENYDPDVQADTETFLNRIVPEVYSI